MLVVELMCISDDTSVKIELVKSDSGSDVFSFCERTVLMYRRSDLSFSCTIGPVLREGSGRTEVQTAV